MADMKETFEGPQGDKWHAWILPGGKEQWDKIENESLKVTVALLARRDPNLIDQTKLEEVHSDIEKIVIRDGESAFLEAVPFFMSIESLSYKLSEQAIDIEVENVPAINIEVQNEPEVAVENSQPPIIEQFGQRFDTFLEQMERQADNIEQSTLLQAQFMTEFQQSQQSLSQELRGIPEDRERANRIDLEYKQEFWTRFEPRSWPKFYETASAQEREMWDDRWQLARAAFYKKATAGLPEKYRENQDLEQLGTERMERLYNLPGVRKMMEGYIDYIKNDTDILLDDGKLFNFWEIENANDFEKFREALREASLGDMDKQGQKEADAVAWNFLWCTNAVESLNSRYAGKEQKSLPSILTAAEYQHVMHPQERFEGKSVSGHYWGVFGQWGVEQINRIKEKYSHTSNDEFVFIPVKKEQYWNSRLDGLNRDPEKAAKGGRRILVGSPECYPVTTTESFLDITKPNGKSLYELLGDKEKIDWKAVNQDCWAIYMYGKFHKATAALEYFNPGKPLEERKEREWVNPFNEIMLNRLGMPKKISDLESKDLTHQTFHNLKIWAVIAGYGGVFDPRKKDDIHPMRGLLLNKDKIVMRSRLAQSQIGFLENGESLDIN